MGPGRAWRGRASAPRRAALGAVAILALLVPALAGCHDRGDAPDPRWHEATLPSPPGPPGRLAVREATRCGDAWYVVGGVFLASPTADQDTRPAAWRSTDGRSWSPVPIAATTYWGQRAILASVACSRGRVVVVGARSGGAHGNPRVTTFAQQGSGPTSGLRDVVAGFSQYGGDRATNVGPVTGGDPGWLITGNRTSGPAVWTSATGVEFERHEGTPGLADDAGFTAFAHAAAWDGERWVVVGGGSARGSLDREPMTWTSSDGERWERHALEGTDGFDELLRVVGTDGGVVAVGVRGETFGAWRRTGGTWREDGTFGRFAEGADGSPFVAGLARAGEAVWVTTSDGARYTLWSGGDSGWRRVRMPARAPSAGGDHVLSVAAAGADVLLLADDGRRARLWTASTPASGG